MHRRRFLQGLGAGVAVLPVGAIAQSQGFGATEFGLVPDSLQNQSVLFQAALDRATAKGAILRLTAGRFIVSEINLPANCTIEGIGAATILVSANGSSLFSSRDKANIALKNLTFEGMGINTGRADKDLLAFQNCENIQISNCTIKNHNRNGIWLYTCSGRVIECGFSRLGQSAIHAQNSMGMQISFNRISDCSNGGIRVWREQNGLDGTIVSNNQITDIGSQSGNGQNGNGINVFLADGVIVANNVINKCAFSAIRANSTNNTIIEGNQCSNSSEVGIFSEFTFSGSIISNNIVDGAGMGISMANLDVGGRLAICSNNIVRNILPFSPTNPDTVPVGIFAEADAAVVSNVVENVPGVGIAAGWGPFLRNVMVSNNIIRQVQIGIAASVADGAGMVKINDNMIVEASTAAIAGMAWDRVITNDLVADIAQFPHVLLSDNMVN